MTLAIAARCPLQHVHTIPMKASFQAWLEAHPNIDGFEVSICPWVPMIRPGMETRCPHCGQPLRGLFWCCAVPLR